MTEAYNQLIDKAHKADIEEDYEGIDVFEDTAYYVLAGGLPWGDKDKDNSKDDFFARSCACLTIEIARDTIGRGSRLGGDHDDGSKAHEHADEFDRKNSFFVYEVR